MEDGNFYWFWGNCVENISRNNNLFFYINIHNPYIQNKPFTNSYDQWLTLACSTENLKSAWQSCLWDSDWCDRFIFKSLPFATRDTGEALSTLYLSFFTYIDVIEVCVPSTQSHMYKLTGQYKPDSVAEVRFGPVLWEFPWTWNWTYGSVQANVWTLDRTIGSGPVQVQTGSNL